MSKLFFKVDFCSKYVVRRKPPQALRGSIFLYKSALTDTRMSEFFVPGRKLINGTQHVPAAVVKDAFAYQFSSSQIVLLLVGQL